MELRLEVVVVPVSDVDRAKDFYASAGFEVDHDVTPREGMRVVQLTPPGSACSIVIGSGMTEMEPGSLNGLQLISTDIESTRVELLARGVQIGETQLLGSAERDGSKFAFFSDPDGNRWALQEIKRTKNQTDES